MLKPTTIFLGEKANQLLHELARENGLESRYFFTKLIIRDAQTEATALTADRLKERLELIRDVNDELTYIINNPPKSELADKDYSMEPRNIYRKIWIAKKRLAERGWSEEAIRAECLKRYGMDIDFTPTPKRNPKRNPNWTGGGRVAAKLKEAKRVSDEAAS